MKFKIEQNGAHFYVLKKRFFFYHTLKNENGYEVFFDGIAQAQDYILEQAQKQIVIAYDVQGLSHVSIPMSKSTRVENGTIMSLFFSLFSRQYR
jgi:hypothetical protein